MFVSLLYRRGQDRLLNGLTRDKAWRILQSETLRATSLDAACDKSLIEWAREAATLSLQHCIRTLREKEPEQLQFHIHVGSLVAQLPVYKSKHRRQNVKRARHFVWRRVCFWTKSSLHRGHNLLLVDIIQSHAPVNKLQSKEISLQNEEFAAERDGPYIHRWTFATM